MPSWPETRTGSRVVVWLVACALMLTAFVALPAKAAVPIGFSWSHLKNAAGATITFSNPTSLQFGPDGRLYVAYQDGTIRVYTVSRTAANQYRASATETINLVAEIGNHDDDGTPNGSIGGRLLLGIAVTGTAASPVIYASSSDPRFGALSGELDLDTNSGVISKLTKTGSAWTRTDVVRGLPRSAEIHAPNGLAIDGSKLYVGVGGFSNHGAPSVNFGLTPEYALSSAIVEIDLNALGTLPYDLPTLDDPARAGTSDANDPFGGNDGKNQAKLVAGGPVKVYGSGFRNPYDLTWHTNGSLYAMDNGGNQGAGGTPIGEGPGGSCTNQVNEGGFTDKDGLYRIPRSAAFTYYQGHPNPTRANRSNTFAGQTPIPAGMEHPVECDFQTSGAEDGSVGKDPNNDALTTFSFSTNGIAEYTAGNFGGAMDGNLVIAQLDQGGTGTVFRVALGAGGGFSSKNTLPVAGYGTDPLDVWAQPDAGPFPGTIWVAMYGSNQIAVFEPTDYDGGVPPPCTGADDPTLDEDADGFDNADEIDNGTDPCSAGSVPPDADGDHTSDLNDPNDDDDARPDTTDPFQIDASDGAQTNLPLDITWDATDPDPGGIIGSGFTGLMVNGSDDYLDLFDPVNMTVGSAAGVFAIDAVPGGDAEAALDTQAYGFQRGFTPSSGAYVAQARINAPFATMTPQGSQSFGLTLGLGDQDNYVKIVADANGGNEGISFLKEVGGTLSSQRIDPLAMPGPDFVDLFLRVDQVTDEVQPRYQVTSGCASSCQTGPMVDLGAPVALPAGWVNGSPLAVGLIATSRGGPVFPATWEHLQVDAVGGGGTPHWESRAGTGFPREELSYVRVGGTFYLTGGLAPGGGDTTRMQAYQPATNSWTEVNTKLPAHLHHVQAVALNGKIYFPGGIDHATGSPVASIRVYDPSTNTWATGASLPAARARGGAGIAVHNGKIYMAGGFRPTVDGALKFFDVYDPVANTWTALPDMPVGRDHFHAQVVNGRLYALSGRNKQISTMRAKNAVYNFATGAWSENLANIPTPRGGGTSVVIGDEILVIGGEGGGQAWNTVEAYDTGTNTWRTLPPMPTARHGMQAVEYQGSVYIAGGSTRQGGGLDTAVQEVFVPGGGSNDVTPPSAPPGLSATAAGSTAISLDWGAATDDTGVASYQVQRSTGGGSFSLVATTGGTTTDHLDTGLAPSTTYTYRVRACDAVPNCGPYGPTAQATTTSGGGGTLFSDGFESGFTWDVVKPPVVRQSAQVHAGAWAVRATSPSASGAAFARKDFGAPQMEVFARSYVTINSKGSNEVVLMRLLDDNLNWVLSLSLNSGGTLIHKNHKAPAQTTNGGVKPALGVWHSLEVHLIVGTSGTVEVWLDGTKVDALTRSFNLGTVGLEHLQIGDTNAGRTFDIVVDDVIVDDAAIGP